METAIGGRGAHDAKRGWDHGQITEAGRAEGRSSRCDDARSGRDSWKPATVGVVSTTTRCAGSSSPAYKRGIAAGGSDGRKGLKEVAQDRTDLVIRFIMPGLPAEVATGFAKQTEQSIRRGGQRDRSGAQGRLTCHADKPFRASALDSRAARWPPPNAFRGEGENGRT